MFWLGGGLQIFRCAASLLAAGKMCRTQIEDGRRDKFYFADFILRPPYSALFWYTGIRGLERREKLTYLNADSKVYCSRKAAAVKFNPLHYGAKRQGILPPHK